MKQEKRSRAGEETCNEENSIFTDDSDFLALANAQIELLEDGIEVVSVDEGSLLEANNAGCTGCIII